jgi:hypothetical protein
MIKPILYTDKMQLFGVKLMSSKGWCSLDVPA